MKLITYKTDKSGISIRIPKSLLNFVAKNNSEYPVKIIDAEKFMEELTFQIKENNFDSSESGLSSFEELIDKAIQEVVDSGSDAAYYIDID